MNQPLTPHEALQLHEIIRSEMIVIKKAELTMAIVSDPDLKSFMQTTLPIKKDTLTRYQGYYNNTVQQQEV